MLEAAALSSWRGASRASGRACLLIRSLVCESKGFEIHNSSLRVEGVWEGVWNGASVYALRMFRVTQPAGEWASSPRKEGRRAPQV